MTAGIWWRDDDAGRDDARLEPLLRLALARCRPVALAVVPEWLEPATVDRILACPRATVLQHGVAHEDHAADGERMIELGGTACRTRLEARLVRGRQRLEAAFGRRFLPVMVPPWNRIDEDVVDRLPALGFTGLSSWGGGCRPGGVRRVDVHVDAVDWRGGRAPKPPTTIERELTAALDASGDAPVGLMTHHMVVDQQGWQDLDRVLGFGHDELNWLSADDVFGER